MEVDEHFDTTDISNIVEVVQFNAPFVSGDPQDFSNASMDVAHNPNSCTLHFLECPKCNRPGHLVLQIEAWDGTKRIVIKETASTEEMYRAVGEQYGIIAGCWILSTTDNTDGIIARNDEITLLEHKLCSMVLYLIIGTTAYLHYKDPFIPNYLKYLLLCAKIKKVLHSSNCTSPTTSIDSDNCTSPSNSSSAGTFSSPSYSSLSTFALPFFSSPSDLGTSATFASISTNAIPPSVASISSNLTSPSYSSLSTFESPSFSSLSEVDTSPSLLSISTCTTTPSASLINISSNTRTPSSASIFSNLTSPSYSSLSTFASPSFSSLSEVDTSPSLVSISTSTTTPSLTSICTSITSPSFSSLSGNEEGDVSSSVSSD